MQIASSLTNGVTICKTLADCSFEHCNRARSIGGVARVPTPIKLREIAGKVFVADVVERTNDAALRQAVIALCKVHMHDNTAHKRLAVINGVVSSKML